MGRWEPDARGRLEQAAMDLYRERGFAETTVAEIAARAGLTERTFFRHYADKREVLFWGAPLLERFIVNHVAEAPPATAPLQAVAAALAATDPMFADRRERARARQALILAHAELREREVMKLTSLGAAVAAALRARGVPEPAASLTAEAGIAIFKVGFQRWLDDPEQRDIAHHVRAALAELRSVVAEERTLAPRARSTSRARRPSSRT